MIKRCTCERKPNGYVTIGYEEFASAQYLRSVADSLREDGLYQDAHWYDARARERKRPGWISDGHSTGDMAFHSVDLDPAAFRAFRALQMAADRTARKLYSGSGPCILSFVYCEY